MPETSSVLMDLKSIALLREQGIRIALRTLPKMLLPKEGSFCMELARDNRPAQFSDFSWRYTMMCLLGLERARQAGYSTDLNIQEIFKNTVKASSQFECGDVGTLLWLAVRLDSGMTEKIAADLIRKAKAKNWDELQGMEIAWMLAGLSFHTHATNKKTTPLLEKLLAYIFTKRISASGLMLHLGRGIRRRFPNFATQIYSVHALSICARLLGDMRCVKQAEVIVNRLLANQRENGGWPWLYDAQTGSVVEPFEVYSVHQHAMAPMALWEFAEATGNDVSDALVKSMKWLESNNELQFPMVDEPAGLIYRSIRRRSPADRWVPYSRVAKICLGARPAIPSTDASSGLEVNLTCRPYELGWLLEAWCGRAQ